MAAVSARPPTGALRTIRSFLRAETDVYFVRGLRKGWSHGWQTSPRYLDIRAVYAFPIQPLSIFLSSSAVERSAVNRLVVGSNPTSGAKQLYRLARRDSATSFGIRTPGFEPSAARQTDRRSARRVRHSRINPTSGAKQLYRLARRDSASPSGFEPSGSSRAQRDRLHRRCSPAESLR